MLFGGGIVVERWSVKKVGGVRDSLARYRGGSRNARSRVMPRPNTTTP